MQQVNSPRSPKRRLPPPLGARAQNSQPIQPLKIPSFRPPAVATPVSQLAPPAPSSKDTASNEQMGNRVDRPSRSTASSACPMPSSPTKLLRPNRAAMRRLLQQTVQQSIRQTVQQSIRQAIRQSIWQSIWRSLRQQHKSWEWLLIGLVAVAGILGGVGTSAMVWLSSLPPLPQCDETAQSLDGQRLFCAQKAANSGKLQGFQTGINLLKDWSSDHPLKPEAQRLIARWSKEILAIAQDKLNHNDLKGAVAIARQVPASSPAYAEVQSAIAHWQAQWQKGEATLKIAQTAIQQKNWTQASKQVLVLGELEPAYWRLQRADALSRQILDGKQAQQVVLEAQRLEAQKLEVQKAAQSGQSQVGEDRHGAIAESSAEVTESSTGETPSLLEDSQPVEIESTEPGAPLSSQVSSDISPTDAAPEKSFEGYYDQRYFENSY